MIRYTKDKIATKADMMPTTTPMISAVEVVREEVEGLSLTSPVVLVGERAELRFELRLGEEEVMLI